MIELDTANVVSSAGLKIALRNAVIVEERPALQIPSRLDGDCEITVDYRDLSLQAAKQGYGVAFSLAANLDDDESSIIECAAKIGNFKEEVLNGSLGRKSPLGAYLNPEFTNVADSSPDGRLRLVREGGMIHCLHAVARSNEFQLIHSVWVGPAKIASLSMEAKSSDDIGQVDVVLEKVTIRKAVGQAY